MDVAGKDQVSKLDINIPWSLVDLSDADVGRHMRRERLQVAKLLSQLLGSQWSSIMGNLKGLIYCYRYTALHPPTIRQTNGALNGHTDVFHSIWG